MIKIQWHRTDKLKGWRKWFWFEYLPDQISNKPMVISLTLFHISFSYFGV